MRDALLNKAMCPITWYSYEMRVPIDPESEAVVSANLLRIAAGRTMVIVSHRLASLTECDQILVHGAGQDDGHRAAPGIARTLRDVSPAVGAAAPPHGRPRPARRRHPEAGPWRLETL